ncbi:RNA polymerase sigma-D factor [Stieleria maiorica]|uniref:RNA polymerase sigma-D factor n=1 Tax=Stieleria maiorica TaxID=2795974 RepID=A0A5B9ME59_9BACT|nr:sigma-70 family RNA polymerase sigma factor [Stieleria maiorica]QEF98526.1 RNA polymerase sigma-D factor [Stieleria maiorica]
MKATLETTYKASPSTQSDRDRLVLDNIDYVGRILSTMTFFSKNDDHRENLHSAGILGLVQAAASFDPDQGVAFRTFAYPRIRGAIVDELRKQSPVSPRMMRHVGTIKRLCETLEPPITPEQLAQRSSLSIEVVLECLEAMRFIKPDDWNDLSDVVHKTWRTSIDSPEDLAEKEEIGELLAELIEQLPEKERLVMTLYYAEELNLAEIGAAMGLSESRTSRLLAAARFRLKEAIRWKTS